MHQRLKLYGLLFAIHANYMDLEFQWFGIHAMKDVGLNQKNELHYNHFKNNTQIFN